MPHLGYLERRKRTKRQSGKSQGLRHTQRQALIFQGGKRRLSSLKWIPDRAEGQVQCTAAGFLCESETGGEKARERECAVLCADTSVTKVDNAVTEWLQYKQNSVNVSGFHRSCAPVLIICLRNVDWRGEASRHATRVHNLFANNTSQHFVWTMLQCNMTWSLQAVNWSAHFLSATRCCCQDSLCLLYISIKPAIYDPLGPRSQ